MAETLRIKLRYYPAKDPSKTTLTNQVEQYESIFENPEFEKVNQNE